MYQINESSGVKSTICSTDMWSHIAYLNDDQVKYNCFKSVVVGIQYLSNCNK